MCIYMITVVCLERLDTYAKTISESLEKTHGIFYRLERYSFQRSSEGDIINYKQI